MHVSAYDENYTGLTSYYVQHHMKNAAESGEWPLRFPLGLEKLALYHAKAMLSFPSFPTLPFPFLFFFYKNVFIARNMMLRVTGAKADRSTGEQKLIGIEAGRVRYKCACLPGSFRKSCEGFHGS